MQCSRPTKSGPPCRQELHGFEIACHKHATDHDHKQTAEFDARWRATSDRHIAAEARLMKAASEAHAKGVDEGKRAEAERLRNWRTESHGDQIVDCEGLAYTWGGSPPLAVGDQVMCPGNWLFPRPRPAVVTGLGTAYTGNLQEILRVLARKPEPAAGQDTFADVSEAR